MAAVRFVLKFAEGHQVSLRHGRFFPGEGEVSRINKLIERYGPIDVYPLFDLSTSGHENSATEKSLGLDRFFCIVMEAERDEIGNLLLKLKQLACIAEAYIEERTDLAR